MNRRLKQLKAKLPEAFGVAGRTAINAMLKLDPLGQVGVALFWWGIGKAAKRGKKKKRGGKK